MTWGGFKRLYDLAQNADVGEGLLAENLLLFEHPSLSKALSLLGQNQIPLFGIRQAKHIGRPHEWEQIVDLQMEMPPKLVEVFAPSPRVNQLDQSRHIADRDVW